MKDIPGKNGFQIRYQIRLCGVLRPKTDGPSLLKDQVKCKSLEVATTFIYLWNDPQLLLQRTNQQVSSTAGENTGQPMPELSEEGQALPLGPLFLLR